MGGFVLDFYIPCVRLCVEVDGKVHDLSMDRDATRDAYLRAQAIHVFRVQAKDVFADAPKVAEQIRIEVLKLGAQ